MVLDLENVMLRLGNDNELFREFVGFYDEDCPLLMEKMRRGIAANNASMVHQAAHTLKGLAANLGGTDLVAATAALEVPARNSDLSHAESLFQAILKEVHILNEALARFRASC